MLLSLLLSCHRTVSPPPQAQADDCELSIEALAGTEWLFLRALPSGEATPSTQTRLAFRQEEGALTALYSAGSLSDIYRYTCQQSGDDLQCETPMDVAAGCRAFIAGTGSCTEDQARTLAPSATPGELAAGRAQAEADRAAQESDEQQRRWKLMNNNLGNKLQLRLQVQVDARRCRLVVTDTYRTIYNGRLLEDSNPVGTNPFVRSDQGALLWRGCDDTRGLVSSATPDATEEAPHAAEYGVGETVHYQYRADTLRAAGEGCTYRYDLWWNARPYREDLTPETEVIDGTPTLRWQFSRTYEAPTPPGQAEVMTMVMTEQCPEAEPVELQACSAVRIQEAAAPSP